MVRLIKVVKIKILGNIVGFGCATIWKEQLLEHICNGLSLINNLQKNDNLDKYMIGIKMTITKSKKGDLYNQCLLCKNLSKLFGGFILDFLQ